MSIIVTGTSSGIGKAIAEYYISQGKAVTGIGRRHTISDALYTAVNCDLSDRNAVEALSFEVDSDVLLINNAGVLGNVKRLSDQPVDIAFVLAVNTVAPTVLMSRFAQLCGDRFSLTVVNISSGSAKRAIPSWGAYCASKAALEMISEVFYLEEREKGKNTKVYAVAPGVVDTNMQNAIRSVAPADFSASETFQNYKENDELADPAIVAQKLDRLLQLPYDGKVSWSLRDIS
jgi:benzil reductase ((S)-benzoin forming)